jgi:hypothetical protein
VADPVPSDEDLRAAAADLDLLVRRLRLFTPRTWRSHRESIQALIAELVRLSSLIESRNLPVPELPDHVLADAVAVIGTDLLSPTDVSMPAGVLAELRTALSDALTATR